MRSPRWSFRSAAHHGGRRLFSAIGSRAHRLPAAARGRLSLERRDGTAPLAEPGAGADGAGIAGFSLLRSAMTVGAHAEHEFYAMAARVWRDGPAPLLDPIEGMSERRRLRIAMLIPEFARGSGGHALLFQILSRLEQRGHTCSVWMHDYSGQMRYVPAGRATSGHQPVLHARSPGPVYNGLRRLARRRRGAGNRLADGASGPAARSLFRPCVRGQRPRAGVLRDLGGVRLGGGYVSPRPVLRRRGARGFAIC